VRHESAHFKWGRPSACGGPERIRTPDLSGRPATVLLCAALLACSSLLAADVVMVADEIPAMETLARELKTRAGVSADIVQQDAMPAGLSHYRAVFVYIHRDITPVAEHAFIDYARAGGRLILLHHSISSGKRKNKDWLPFLGVELPERPFEEGGYKYFDPADFELLNMAQSHPVMKGIAGKLPIWQSEVYVNHVLKPNRTILLSIRYTEPKSGITYEQPTGGWYLKTGKGDVFYFMVGYRAWDFEQPEYAQIIANALMYRAK
jgi:type 1 glutamine amidotransferase